ncbi:hypothetical protein N0V82_006531 [Gnomoniopsis sp. IMI 355080]|nr:hypothetical protein N0V82_006531 [Gnomoniopsis sp. IMI 355080]
MLDVFTADLMHCLADESLTADHLDKVIYDIEASTSALSQLNVILDQDKTSTTQVFTSAGHQDIETLAIKCNLIFKALILIIEKATVRNEAQKLTGTNDIDRKVSSWAGSSGVLPRPMGYPKKQAKDEGQEQEEVEKDGNDDEKSKLLIGPVPDLTSPKSMGLIGKISGRISGWSWLSNRITYCQVQLRWVRKSLLLHVQMGRLTCLANQSSAIANGSFESQLTVRASLFLQRKSQLQYTKARARKQERAEKNAQLRLDAHEDTDKESIHSSDSGATTSTVVVEEPPVVKNPDKRLAAPVLSSPPVICSNGLGPSIHTVGHTESQTPIDPNEIENRKDEASGKPSTSLEGLRLKLSDTMSEWTHKIFGREDEFSKDWESQELEAWVFRTSRPTFSTPMKVPFGHQRLQYGLKKIRSKKINSAGRTTFSRYLNTGIPTQVYVDEVVKEANRLRTREKICLAFEEYRLPSTNDAFMIVFFSLGEEKAPISFQDCIGRKMTLPFERCRVWEVAGGIGPHVLEGHYDLEDAKSGEHILPGLWSDTIKPGASIHMKMWPDFNMHPLLRFYQSPPFCPSLYEVAENAAQRLRTSRIQHMLNNTGLVPIGPSGLYPPAGIVLRPPMPMPRPPPPPIFRRRSRTVSSNSTVDEDEMTGAEEEELKFVNFREELERIENMTATEMLAKYTQLQDVVGQEFLDEWSPDNSGYSSGSSGSSYSSSSSHSIVD